jgi:hypothetical protein
MLVVVHRWWRLLIIASWGLLILEIAYIGVQTRLMGDHVKICGSCLPQYDILGVWPFLVIWGFSQIKILFSGSFL